MVVVSVAVVGKVLIPVELVIGALAQGPKLSDLEKYLPTLSSAKWVGVPPDETLRPYSQV